MEMSSFTILVSESESDQVVRATLIFLGRKCPNESEILPSTFFSGVEETGRTVTHILEEGVTWFSAVLYPPAVAAAGVREGGRRPGLNRWCSRRPTLPEQPPGRLPRHHSAGPAAVWLEGETDGKGQ